MYPRSGVRPDANCRVLRLMKPRDHLLSSLTRTPRYVPFGEILGSMYFGSRVNAAIPAGSAFGVFSAAADCCVAMKSTAPANPAAIRVDSGVPLTMVVPPDPVTLAVAVPRVARIKCRKGGAKSGRRTDWR